MEVYLSRDLAVLVPESSGDGIDRDTIGEEQACVGMSQTVGVLLSPMTFSVVSRIYLL